MYEGVDVQVVDALQRYLEGAIGYSEFVEALGYNEEEDPFLHTVSYEEGGILTKDKGFSFKLANGDTVFVTVQVCPQ